MPTTIPEVLGNVNVATALFVDLQLGDTTYYISDCYTNLTLNGNEYTSLGALLEVGDFISDYKATQGSIQMVISGIPNNTNYTRIVQGAKIKGGDVSVRRAFFDPDTLDLIGTTGYLRFSGIISNWSLEEDTNFIQGVATSTLLLECVSVYTVLTKRIAGQRTNGTDRRRFFSADTSFDRVTYIAGTLPEIRYDGN